MQFQFLPLRFEFTARESIHFPPGKAANILRGALGTIFRKIVCAPECLDPSRCNCPYARVFQPATLDHAAGPSGLSDWPRPFVFRARHLDGRTVQPSESFHFDLHLFTLDPAVLTSFVLTFAALADEGLGPRRGKADLQSVRRLGLGTSPEQLLFQGSTPIPTPPIEAATLDLEPLNTAPNRIRVEFLTPTELKHQQTIATRPDFPILFARIRDRISTLRALYGPGPLEIDFRQLAARAAAVQITHCDLRKVEATRRSTRTGQTHSIGGFVGMADYQGEMAEFLPYLEAARWVGIGRQAVWGKGEIAIIAL